MFELTVRLKFERSTKNTHLYKSPEAPIDSIYVKKSSMLKPLDEIELVVREASKEI